MGDLSVHRGNLGLQGGGSGCAYTAGVLYRLLAEPSIEFNRVTGTSGGALCGFAITQPINKKGYTPEGRQLAQTRLVELWDEIAVEDSVAHIGRHVDSFLRLNPFLNPHLKSGYSAAMASLLKRTTINPNALQSDRHIKLIVNAVAENGTERLFKGKELNTAPIMASGALPPYFHPVSIDGTRYLDGAILGGSNPPIQPLIEKKSDFVMFVMTNPPEKPIIEQLQKDMHAQDVRHTNGLILHQAYNEIAHILARHESGDPSIPPVHVIYPNIPKPWSAQDKQRVDRSTISRRFEMGIESADAFLEAHSGTIAKKSSVTLQSLRDQARENYRRLVAA